MSQPATATVQLTYVTAPACHDCEHGRAVLVAIAYQIPLTVREVSLDPMRADTCSPSTASRSRRP